MTKINNPDINILLSLRKSIYKLICDIDKKIEELLTYNDEKIKIIIEINDKSDDSDNDISTEISI